MVTKLITPEALDHDEGRAEPTHTGAAAELLRSRGEAWFDAVCERHSSRHYSRRHVDADDLDAIRAVTEQFRPFDDSRVALVTEPCEGIFRGVVGSYGKVTGAPCLLVMIGDDSSSDERAHAHTGYTGEAIVLEATARGLGTCWVGGFFDSAAVAACVDLEQSESVLAVSPLGHPTPKASLTDELMRTLARSNRRKTLEEIAEDPDHWPTWARAAAECARLAPSAMNRQPWRFWMDGEQLVLGRNNARELSGVTKSLDCGIAMLHAELGARSSGVEVAWEDGDGSLELARLTAE